MCLYSGGSFSGTRDSRMAPFMCGTGETRRMSYILLGLSTMGAFSLKKPNVDVFAQWLKAKKE